MSSPQFVPLGDEGVTIDFNDFTEGAGQLRSDLLDDIGKITNRDYSVTFERVYEVHGGYEKGSTDDSTLLVLKIIPYTTTGRAFKRLRLELVINKAPGSDPDDEAPWIVTFEPGQDFVPYFKEHITKVTNERGTELSLAGQPPGGNIGVAQTWTKSEERDRRKLLKLTAGADKKDIKVRKRNCVWFELDAAEESDGVGDHMVVAVLIKREEGSQFVMSAEAKAGFGGFKDAWNKITSSPFSKQKVITFSPFGASASQGAVESIPKDVVKNNLHAASQQNILKRLAYVHLPEKVDTAVLYSGTITHSTETQPAPSLQTPVAPDPALAPTPAENVSVHPRPQQMTAKEEIAEGLPDHNAERAAAIDNRSVEHQSNPRTTVPSDPRTSVLTSSRADRHRKMAALYQELAKLHREEAEEALASDEAAYVDRVGRAEGNVL